MQDNTVYLTTYHGVGLASGLFLWGNRKKSVKDAEFSFQVQPGGEIS